MTGLEFYHHKTILRCTNNLAYTITTLKYEAYSFALIFHKIMSKAEI